ncbi:hypothetical protein AGRO_4611 [Agrobacterium sp. ATCC 31749]|nr:hypothetical protein AGRO_4611 [Agrobacterium sp. ATCC 31749]
MRIIMSVASIITPNAFPVRLNRVRLGERGASYATIVSGVRNRRIALPALRWQVSQPRMNG